MPASELRALTSLAFGSARIFKQGSSRILGGSTRTPILKSFDSQACTKFSMINGEGASKYRCFSHLSGSQPQLTGKFPRYWPALVAGLVGLGGATLLYKDSIGNDFPTAPFPTAFCASNDDCIERKCETSDCLRKSDKEEEMIQKANAELERALRDTKGKSIEFTEAALKAYCDAIDMIKSFMNKVYCAVEEENLDSPRFEDVWCDVANDLTRRCDLAKQATEKGQCAWELLRRLREVIDNGKACKYTSCNPLLITAEDTLMCAEKEMCSRQATMDKLMKESRVAEQYRNIVEEFRRDLKAEADSVVPALDCRVTLTDNEANMILTHAYKKILRVQKEMNRGIGGGKRC